MRIVTGIHGRAQAPREPATNQAVTDTLAAFQHVAANQLSEHVSLRATVDSLRLEMARLQASAAAVHGGGMPYFPGLNMGYSGPSMNAVDVLTIRRDLEAALLENARCVVRGLVVQVLRPHCA